MYEILLPLWILVLYIGEVFAPIGIPISVIVAIYAYFTDKRILLIVSIILLIIFALAHLYTSSAGWSM